MGMRSVAVFLVCLLAALGSKARTHFIYTNDDIFSGFGSNTVSGFVISADGSLSKLAGSPFSTQGSGGGGMVLTQRVVLRLAWTGSFFSLLMRVAVTLVRFPWTQLLAY
jgi:hypothetical protein